MGFPSRIPKTVKHSVGRYIQPFYRKEFIMTKNHIILGIAVMALLSLTAAFAINGSTGKSATSGCCSKVKASKSKKVAACPADVAKATCCCGDECVCCDGCKDGNCICEDCKCCACCKAAACCCGDECVCCDGCKDGNCVCEDCKCCARCKG